MDKHYTYEEIKKLINSPTPIPDEIIEHIAVCEKCSEVFFSTAEEMPVSPIKNVGVNIMERAAIKKQQMKDMMYNARVVFGVIVAVLMLFQTPLPNPHAETDIIEKNRQQMTSMEEFKEEFIKDIQESFDRFTENYMKGSTNDKTEE